MLKVFRSSLFALCLLSACPPARATATNAPASRGDRYLLIMDVSSAMKKRLPNTETAVAQLIASGMNDQMKRGDTMGVWFYNEQLYAGVVPLQTWSPGEKLQIASRVVNLYHETKFEKKSRFAVVAGALERIAKSSNRLTVVVVSDGTAINGTPYDTGINDYFKNNFDVQRDARMPFITTLRAKAGQYLGHIVNPAPWPVEFPEFPPEPEVVETPKPKVEEAAKPAPRPVVPSLIVIGTKRETNVPPPTVLPQPQLAPPAPEPKPPARSSAEILAAQLLAEAQAQETPVAQTNIPAVETQNSAPAAVREPQAPAASTPPSSAPFSMPAPAPSPVPTATINDTSAAAPVLKPVAPEPKSELSTPSPAPAAPPVQTAVVLPARENSMRLWFLIAGAALLGLAVGVTLMLLRRPRSASRESYITRALDRDQK